MRVLISAFQASPLRGSEYAVGWGWLRTLAQNHAVTVITNDITKSEIESTLGDLATEFRNVKFCFVPWSQRWVNSQFWPLIRVVQYAKWRSAALDKAKRLAMSESFDVCHHINAVGFRDVIPLWETGLPFVWGPVGGAVFAPRRLLPALTWRGRVFFMLKNFANYLALRFARRSRMAAMTACGVIAATPEIQSHIRRYWNKESVVVPEVGLPYEIARQVNERAAGEPLRIVWCGRLEQRKALGILLYALAETNDQADWRLDVIGDGPVRDSWIHLATSLGLAERVCFMGNVPRSGAMEAMQAGHVFVMTSVYDLTTNVLCEAMSIGLPVICFPHQAAAQYVGELAGCIITGNRLEKVQTNLARAVENLYENEDKRQAMARNALVVAERFAWELKAKEVDRIYSRIEESSVPCALR